jgi:exocyst complex component 2
MTTTAFKIAGGVEASSSSATRPLKQHPTSGFVSKITKGFLDSLYAILDGLVLLASDESPIVRGKRPDISNAVQMGLNPLELLDLTDSVCQV